MLNFSFDKSADAVYIRVASGKIAKTKRLHKSLVVDFDKKGKVRGVEILNASDWFSQKNSGAPQI